MVKILIILVVSIAFPASATALSCADQTRRAAISEFARELGIPASGTLVVEVFSAEWIGQNTDFSEMRVVLGEALGQNPLEGAYDVEVRHDTDGCEIVSIGTSATPPGVSRSSSGFASCEGRIKQAALAEFLKVGTLPGSVAEMVRFRLRERNGRIDGQITLRQALGEELLQKVYLAHARQMGNGDDCDGLSIEERGSLGTSRSH